MPKFYVNKVDLKTKKKKMDQVKDKVLDKHETACSQ